MVLSVDVIDLPRRVFFGIRRLALVARHVISTTQRLASNSVFFLRDSR